MQRKLLDQTQHHLGKAQGSAFTKPPLTTFLGPAGTTKLAESVLQGKELPSVENMGKAVKAILTSLQTDSSETIDNSVTKEALAAGLKAWREGTSTSPSHCHLGHYKALVCPLPEKNKPPDDIRDRLLQVQATLMDIAATTGFVYNRWLTIYHSMLEKIAGKPRMEKLRIINIYEADLNLLLGMMFRQLTRHGEANQAFGDETWGSRKGKSATDALLLKILTYLLSELTLTSLGSFNNDAKACYDRIVILLAMLRARQLGMPASICEIVAKINTDAKFHIKTQMGVSEEYFSHSEEKPIHGSGQGRRDSTDEWLNLSSMIIKLMHEVSQGVSFSDPLSTAEIKRLIDAFVDDATIFNNAFTSPDQSPETLAQSLQEAAQWWEELLTATGGKLELDKCFYYLIYWLFNNEGEARLATKDDFQHIKIMIESHDPASLGQMNEITQREPGEAHKTLGFMAHPLGDLDAEFKRLKSKANSHAARIRATSSSPREARTMYSAYYLAGMKYTLPASNFSCNELVSIQAAPRAAFLNAMGYHSNTPSAVAFGPPELLGIGYNHLYPVQGSEKLDLLLGQLRFLGPVGKHIQITLQWLQLHAGVTYSLFERPDQTIPYIKSNWFTGLLEFLRKCNAHVKIDGIYTVKKRRHGDHVLMEWALAGLWTTLQLEQINRVRIHLQIECLSDMCNAQGTLMRRKPTSQSTMHWPRQPSPGPKSWKIWNTFMLQFRQKRTQRLKSRMGAWFPTPTRTWATCLDTDMSCLTIQTPDGWGYHFANPGRMSTNLWTAEVDRTFTDDQPANTCPVDIKVINQRIHFFPPSHVLPPPTDFRFRPSRTFEHYIQQLPEWEKQLFAHLNYQVQDDMHLSELLASIEPVTMVTDGGEKSDHGYFGWAIGTDTHVICKNMGIAYGWPTSSYRSEAYGRLSLLCFLYHYVTFFLPQ
mgnify:CR=1 FL=1